MERKSHWEQVYHDRSPAQVSWYQSQPQPSWSMIENSGVPPAAAIIDVGGGASNLVDHLLASGWSAVTVLDISAAALGLARERLGAKSGQVTWLEADITAFEPPRRYALWHDRAVLHFLTDADDRARYRSVLDRALVPGGQVIIGAFALDGPDQCSGLPVVRYSPRTLAALLGPQYDLQESRHIAHRTPWESEQNFVFCRFRYQPGNL